jgi:aminopeptidase N
VRTLTREKAAERAELLRVASYDVRLDLREEDGFTSVTEVRFSVTRPGAATFLELDGELLELTRGGARVDDPVVTGNRIALDDLAAEEVVTVTARCAWSRTGEGLQRSTDPADGRAYVYAQAFLDDAQRLLACFDQPDLKAVLRLTVDAPEDWVVLSTTRATPTPLEGGTRHAFAPTPPLPPYLFTVAAGPWHGETRWHGVPGEGGIELGVWCRQSVREHLEADEVLDLTARSFDLQQPLFGRPYPFGDSYDQVFVPDFNAGAMENPGMVTFSEALFVYRSRVTDGERRTRGQVIAHEMAHMWFGDLVTMRWWDDLWLNESFAELLGVLTVDRALPYDGAWPDFGLARKAWGYRADASPTTHPVADDVPDNRAALLNFDGISYAKGASVLRQLMAWVGEDAFFTGVREHLERSAWGNATLDDLLGCLERASGRDLAEWARLWLRTSGFSTLRVQDGAVVQSGDVLRPHRLALGLYDERPAGLVLRERVLVDVEGERTPVTARADLVLPNSGDLTFAAVRFDERSLEALRRGLSTVDDPLDRVVAWGGLWDATRSAELPARDLVEVVVRHAVAEPDASLVEALLHQARTAATLFTADPSVLAGLHAGLVEALARQAPGSDAQLVVAKAVADTAADGGLVARWLEGSPPDGLVVDADLRWHLVVRLAALGHVDRDRVEAELAADRSDAGRRGAGRALAALPDPEVKAEVWAEAVGDAGITTERARSLGTGFWQHHQDLTGYVDRYFADLPAVFDERSPTVGPTLARLLYPRTVVSEDVLDRTDALLARDLAAPLRRTLLEVRDDLARAVAARRL